MEEKSDIKIERHLVGRIPFEYKNTVDYTRVEPDSGYGTAGAKLDPRTGALMYDRYEDIYGKQQVTKEDMKEDLIEFSKDSQAMIHLKEDFETIFSAKGDVRRNIGKGIISVRNLSDKDRLWDVDVWLREETGIADVDFDKIAAVEIEPGYKVSKEYGINQFEPFIIIHELISTHPEYPESVIFEKHKSTQVTFQLGVVNHGTNPYTGVVFRKEIPLNLRNIIISNDSEEDASLNENELVWRINELKPNEAKVLRFGADIDAESPEETPTGEITLKATGEDTLTVFTIKAFDGMCKNMYFVEADETDEPGKWLCNFICENTSSFGVEILRAEVRDARGENIYLNIDRPGIKLPPNDRWESKSWIVEDKDRPSFIKSLVLNVIPSISKEITFNLTKESDMFKMAGLEFSKTFDKDVVVAGRVTDAVAGIEITNVGSAPMEHIVVRDTLPKFMTPPTSFRIDRDGVPLTENVKISIAPEDGAEAVDQQLSIIIRDLSRHGGPLMKGEKIVITYMASLIKPVPDSKIRAPTEVDGKTIQPGPVITGEVKGEMPTINTVQILRKFSIGKSIEQGGQIGEYNIGILYKNRGNQPIKDLIIKDILPKNFVGIDYSLDPEQKPTEDEGTILVWTIPEIKEGETTTIFYKIKGEGEYRPSDAQIFYNSVLE